MTPTSPQAQKSSGSEMTTIHPTAQIEPGAVIGAGAFIGPYCVIGANVVIGDRCRLLAHVHVAGHTTIGAETVVYPFASLGTPPQSVHYHGGPTRLVIGAKCDIRQYVTMNTGTEDGGGVTTVGDRGFFMVGSHVGHDCHVGSHVVFANGVLLGGHCVVGDHVVMGGLAAVHQFARIGPYAMVGGASGVRGDVIPFGLVHGNLATLHGINTVGMRRNNFSADIISAVRTAYRAIFLGAGTFAERVDAAERKFGGNAEVARIIAFIRDRGGRPLCQPDKRQNAA
jgi:UDP-N-acetylglucosamine acyltransferase